MGSQTYTGGSLICHDDGRVTQFPISHFTMKSWHRGRARGGLKLASSQSLTDSEETPTPIHISSHVGDGEI
jgi:hypothetical protein